MKIKENTFYFTQKEIEALSTVSGLFDEILWCTPENISFYYKNDKVLFADREEIADFAIKLDNMRVWVIYLKENKSKNGS